LIWTPWRREWHSSLSNVLHSPDTTSLLNQNILPSSVPSNTC
jgi:hypothetical protein